MNNNSEKILSNLMKNNLEKKSYEILWITIWKNNLIKSYEWQFGKILWNLMNNNLEKNLMNSYE